MCNSIRVAAASVSSHQRLSDPSFSCPVGRGKRWNETKDLNQLFGWKDAFRGIFFFALERCGCDDSVERRWLASGGAGGEVLGVAIRNNLSPYHAAGAKEGWRLCLSIESKSS
jgi:hypothetical protein